MIASAGIVGASLIASAIACADFKRRDDALGAAQRLKPAKRFVVGRVGIQGAAVVVQLRVLRPDRRVIQAGRDRVGHGDLAVLVLQHVGVRCPAARRAGRPANRAACLPDSMPSPPASTPISRTSSFKNGMKNADRVRAAADARDHHIGQASGQLQDLAARFAPDHRLEIAHHRRIRMRPERRAEQVIRIAELVTQSRIASLIASLSVREPVSTPRTSAPSSRMRNTFGLWRAMSSVPMYTTHSRPSSAHTVARGHAVLARAGFGDDAASCPCAWPAGPGPARC